MELPHFNQLYLLLYSKQILHLTTIFRVSQRLHFVFGVLSQFQRDLKEAIQVTSITTMSEWGRDRGVYFLERFWNNTLHSILFHISLLNIIWMLYLVSLLQSLLQSCQLQLSEKGTCTIAWSNNLITLYVFLFNRKLSSGNLIMDWIKLLYCPAFMMPALPFTTKEPHGGHHTNKTRFHNNLISLFLEIYW